MSGELSPVEAGLAMIILLVVVCGVQGYRVVKGAGMAQQGVPRNDVRNLS